MPVAAITLLSGFLMPLLASMVGGYQLAGEAETDTLKTWLMHSISRGGVVVSKWGVAIIYVAIGLVLVAAGALVAGALAFGLHAAGACPAQSVPNERAFCSPPRFLYSRTCRRRSARTPATSRPTRNAVASGGGVGPLAAAAAEAG